MSIEEYQQKMASMGVSRGQLGDGFNYDARVLTYKQATLLEKPRGMRVSKPEISEDLSKFQPDRKGLKCQEHGRMKKVKRS